MRMVFVLAVCAILTLSFLIACDRSLTKPDDLLDPYPDTWFPPGMAMSPADTMAVTTTLIWMREHGAEYGVAKPSAQLRLGYVEWSEQGVAQIGLGRIHEGVSVWYSGIALELRFDIEPELGPEVVRSTLDPDFSLDVSARPGISEEQAVRMFRGDHGGEGSHDDISDPGLWIRKFKDNYHLCWSIFAQSGMDIENGDFSGTTLDYWMDAHTGDVLYNLVNAYGP